MDNEEKYKFCLYMAILFGGLAIGILLGLYFKSNTVQNTVQLDIRDRENGICAEMYKEGFNWGYGQFCLAKGESEFSRDSKDETKELLYRMADDCILNN